MNRSARWSGRDHHPPCPGGCNQLADECACPPARRNPLGSMRIEPAIGSHAKEPPPWPPNLETKNP